MLGRKLFPWLQLFGKPSNVTSDLLTIYSVVWLPIRIPLSRVLSSFSWSIIRSSTTSVRRRSSKLLFSSSSKNMDTTDRTTDFKSLNENDWRRRLDKQTFKVCRLKGTEYPGSGKYLHHSEKGTYVCICCRAQLFRSEDKFNHCGWPSFRQAMYTTEDGNEDASNIKHEFDGTLGMQRTEVLCKKCHSHLGHVFDDGPEPFGKRFCINSVSLDFVKD